MKQPSQVEGFFYLLREANSKLIINKDPRLCKGLFCQRLAVALCRYVMRSLVTLSTKCQNFTLDTNYSIALMVIYVNTFTKENTPSDGAFSTAEGNAWDKRGGRILACLNSIIAERGLLATPDKPDNSPRIKYTIAGCAKYHIKLRLSY